MLERDSDISAEEKACHRLEEPFNQTEKLRLMESAVTHANDVILITDVLPDPPGPRVLYVNPAFTRMTGYEPHEIIGKTPRILQGPDTCPETRAFIRRKLLEWQSFEVELLNYRKDGTPFWVELSVRPVADEAGIYTHWISVQRDITRRKLTEIERERMLDDAIARASCDSLTGLYNYGAFHQKLEEHVNASCSSGKPFAVALVDVKNFKYFNEAWGHSAGDQVLKRIAAALRSRSRPEDILARLGGDEFALILPGVNADLRDRVQQRMEDSLADLGYRPEEYNSEIPIALSVGVAVFPNDGSASQDLLRAADAHLRRAKMGKEEAVTEALREMLHRKIRDFAMLDALVAAVDNKDRYTRKHSEEVLVYCTLIAQQLDLDEETRASLMVAALIHDVGKIGVPDRILRLPGNLSPAEYEAMKAHPDMGAIIVHAVKGLEHTLDAVRYHHERWDGNGYPNRLQGTQIPLSARIMAVADAFSAMTTDRPYRCGMTYEEALAELQNGAGEQWDPDCVAALRTAIQSQWDLECIINGVRESLGLYSGSG